MKRKIACFFVFLGLCYNVFPQTIDNKDDIDYYDFIGIYLSVEFITLLENTKNYIAAMHFIDDNGIETILAVTRDSISFDHYAYEFPQNLSVWEIMKYKFEYNNGYYIIDYNGNRYKKISDYIENWSDDIHRNYVTNIIMKELLDQDEIILNENGFIILSLSNRQFRAMTHIYIFLDNANLYLVDGSNNYYVLEIKNNEYIIYILDRGWKKGTIIWSKKI